MSHAFVRFPRKSHLYHGTACDAVSRILKEGLAPDTHLTTSLKEAEWYAKRKSALVQLVKYKEAGSRVVPPEPGGCILKVICADKDLLWYRSDEEPTAGGKVDNFFSYAKIPGKCIRLRRRL